MSRETSLWRRMDDTGVPMLLVRLVLAATFIYTGSKKVAEPIDFLKQVRMYRMLPEAPAIFLNAAAIVLPWMEVVAGAALLVGIQIRGAAALIAVMLCAFTPAIFLRALSMQHETGESFFEIAFDCGCGAGVVVIWTKLLANAGLLASAMLALVSRSRRFRPAAWLESAGASE